MLATKTDGLLKKKKNKAEFFSRKNRDRDVRTRQAFVRAYTCVYVCVCSIYIIMCAKTRAAVVFMCVCMCVVHRHKGSTTSDDLEESGRACIEKSVCVRVRAININC